MSLKAGLELLLSDYPLPTSLGKSGVVPGGVQLSPPQRSLL